MLIALQMPTRASTQESGWVRVQAQVIERPANVRFESEVAIWKLTFVGVPEFGCLRFCY